MKKRKLNLAKLSLNKEVISSLSQEKVTGGATANTCFKTCVQSCLCSVFDCQPQTQIRLSCLVLCQPSALCPVE
ncbi:hypothetical protein HHL17_18220 [Chitinophaga sp. G-6-1-13]|uniref:Uncharacterized protein n=1 Tax=Chitinophaga fulva TaxID=2728842 RepID=A0A848GQU9_9BACT|nr:class I lanthipeptide [Chitinophaga fulva]NML39143.1 hypothetical protein [Chitinophaga fulva]